MKLSTKIAVLSAILVADLSFFLFFKTYLPCVYEFVFQKLPWPDNLEKTFAIILGLAVAILSTSSIAYVVLKHLLKSIQQG
ncbi:MAG: hypothetical protein ACE5OY_08505 [Candidatus Bathyarchaeia archaeon]